MLAKKAEKPVFLPGQAQTVDSQVLGEGAHLYGSTLTKGWLGATRVIQKLPSTAKLTPSGKPGKLSIITSVWPLYSNPTQSLPHSPTLLLTPSHPLMHPPTHLLTALRTCMHMGQRKSAISCSLILQGRRTPTEPDSMEPCEPG